MRFLNGFQLSSTVVAIFLFVTPSLLSKEAEPQEIAIESSFQYVGKFVTVAFMVKSGRTLKNSSVAFLNSKEDHQDRDNFSIVIKDRGYYELHCEGIDDPGSHFSGTEVKVYGILRFYRGRPEIVVTRSNQIEIVDPFDN